MGREDVSAAAITFHASHCLAGEFHGPISDMSELPATSETTELVPYKEIHALAEAIEKDQELTPILGPLQEGLEKGIESGQVNELLAELREPLAQATELLGDAFEKVGDLVGLVLDGLEKGITYLAEHPEALRAITQGLVLVTLAAYEPKGFLQLLEKQPQLLTQTIADLSKVSADIAKSALGKGTNHG